MIGVMHALNQIQNPVMLTSKKGKSAIAKPKPKSKWEKVLKNNDIDYEVFEASHVRLDLKFYFRLRRTEKDCSSRAKYILRRFLMPYQSDSPNPRLSKTREKIEAYKVKYNLSVRATYPGWFEDWEIKHLGTVNSLRASKNLIIELTNKALREKYFCLNSIGEKYME